MKVLQPGQRVFINEDMGAIIIGVTLYDNQRVMYEVAWWSGRSRQVGLLGEKEISPMGTSKYLTMTCEYE